MINLTLYTFYNRSIMIELFQNPGPLFPKLTNLDFLAAGEEKKKRDFSKVVALLWESADSLFCSRMPVLYFSNYILNE